MISSKLERWALAPALFLLLAISACSPGGPSGAGSATRVVTQTPWIIYVQITNTPEPATVTPLPTVTSAKPASTPTRRVTPKPVPTKSATAVPVAVAPTATPVPACSLNGVSLIFPENGVSRIKGAGTAFIFKWTPFQSGRSDPQTGYRIDIRSTRAGTGQFVNGDVVYVSHNQFLDNGSQYIYDPRKVSSLAGGDNAVVNWQVTVVKTTGSFDNQGGISGTAVNCSPPSQLFAIQLVVP